MILEVITKHPAYRSATITHCIQGNWYVVAEFFHGESFTITAGGYLAPNLTFDQCLTHISDRLTFITARLDREFSVRRGTGCSAA